MPVNLVTLCSPENVTRAGITYTWSGINVHAQGTGAGVSYSSIINDYIDQSPFTRQHTYELRNFHGTQVHVQGYYYVAAGQSNIGSFDLYSDGTFTIPAAANILWVRIRANGNIAVNETVSVEIYDITYTDVDADCDMMMSVVGYPNSWFYPKWVQFAAGELWDGQSCSEIACCISYMAGNLSKIYVSNYAQGLADLFRANGRFGNSPSRGAFIWFDYDNDGVPDHTGRVYEILGDGTIHTVEGNVGGLVVERYYPADTSYIYGYGYPNYDFDPAGDPGDPTPPKFTFVPFWRHMRRLRGN